MALTKPLPIPVRTKEVTNFLRLADLVIRVSPRAVRTLFDKFFNPGGLQIFLNQIKTKLEALQKKRVINQSQMDILYPQSGTTQVTSSDINVPLMFVLFRNFTKLKLRDTLPPSTDTSEGDDLSRIRHYRNFIAHSADGKIDDSSFWPAWKENCEAIQRLGGNTFKDECETLLAADIDNTNRGIYLNFTQIEQRLIEVAKSVQNKLRAVFQQPSVELEQILATDSSYESYDMRVMVVGRYGVGKSTLVMLLVGDDIPKEQLPTDGISLLEGRCVLEIGSKEWILIDKDDYNPKDIVYNRMLMQPTKTDTIEEQVTSKSPEPQPSDKPVETPSRHVESSSAPQLPNVQPTPIERTSKTKLSKKEFQKQLELALKNGTYKMMVGRLIFWDFGGQYVYYTTHQSFMTYRALFLVVFDGSKNLHEVDPDEQYIPGQHGKPTAAVFLQHWVNSILTYCKQISGDIPKILFVGTHKDKIPQQMVNRRRAIVFDAVDQLFKEHEGRNHLVLEHRIFVNATDRNDPEVEGLKKVITDLTFSHPCWGERMPNAWVPLELEIAELVAEGKQLISLIELEELNKASELFVLPTKDLKAFLRIQHSLGKIVYFDTPQLRDYVIIRPLYMVEVMKSFVTDKHFWPTDQKGRETFGKMSTQGIIKKIDLFSIWERKQFSQILPYKEFIFDMLVHLDILSEQRRYDLTTGIRLPVEDYFVPCMLARINSTDYMEKECVPRRAICMVFAFKGMVVPTALPNRLIASCLNIWALKSYRDERMIFSGLVVLSYDKSHELVICVESNSILLFIVHKRSRDLIVSDIATSVRECMQTSLERISDFYQRSIIRSSSQQLPFNVQLACPELKCYLPETEVFNKGHVCKGHGFKYEVEVWNQDKNKEICNIDCKGLSEDALSRMPSDPELLRLSLQFDKDTMYKLAIHLGITVTEWDDMRENHPRNIEIVKFLMLIQWRNKNSGTFKDISEALISIDMATHKLCQVKRKQMKDCGIREDCIGLIPTDEILDALARTVGKLSFQLGIALGLRVYELENIQLDFNSNIDQTRQILQRWRNERTVKATFDVLQQALVEVGIGPISLKEIIEDIGVKQHNFQE